LLASEASTVNVAVPPAQIVTSDGFVVIEATGVIVTVTLPAPVPLQDTASRTLAIVYVVAAFGFTVIVPEVTPLPNVATVPSFNSTVVVPVPVSVTPRARGLFTQTAAVVDESVAVGNG
jgi:hypothetical protein